MASGRQRDELQADRQGWELDESRRWTCDTWSGLLLKFEDGINPNTEWSWVGVDARDLMHLQRILLHVTELKAMEEFDVNVDTRVDLESILEMADNPVPVLRAVESSFCNILWLLKAAKSGKLRSLESLYVYHYEVDDEVIELLSKAIEVGNLPMLFSLSVTFEVNSLVSSDLDSLVRLAESLRRSRCSFRTLHIGIPSPDSRGHVLLADILKSGSIPCLEDLRIIHLHDIQQAWEAYENAFSSGKLQSLRELSFGGSGMSDREAKWIAGALKSGNITSLEKLDLSENAIGDDGIQAWADFWRQGGCKDLEWLLLGGNKFTDRGFLALSDALKSGHLNSLTVIRTSVPNEVCGKAIVSAFASNLSLVAYVWIEDADGPRENLHETQVDVARIERLIEHHRERNREYVKTLAGLGETYMVSATHAKVYLCGNQETGKTTLRKSIQRGFWKALFTRELQPHKEEGTRGINIARLKAKGKNGVSLAMWDMAGQEDYHLLHYAFFREMANSNGGESSFVVLCNTQQSKEEMAQAVKYWMTFVASSCSKNIDSPRNVFAVLNLSQGDSQGKVKYWKQCIEKAQKKFHGHLKIFPEFVEDVRKRKNVQVLKKRLLSHSNNMLKHRYIPNVCQEIQSKLRLWAEEKKGFPVFSLEQFVEKSRTIHRYWSKTTLQNALKLLNQMGVLMYIAPSNIVVLDPEWICSEIVGDIFLDAEMLLDGSSNDLFKTKVNPTNGSVGISELKEFFKTKQEEWNDLELDHLIKILLWMGLSFRGNENVLFIPALIRERRTVGQSWESFHLEEHHREDDWVMGYSVEQMEQMQGEVTLAPIGLLWRRFQVHLGQEFGDFDAIANHDFSIGKYFVVFKEKEMAVLIQATEVAESPAFEKVTFLVKPLDRHATTTRVDQIDLANKLVDMFLKYWIEMCRGVDYVHRVIWPWLACKSLRDLAVEEHFKIQTPTVSEVRQQVLVNGMGYTIPHRRVGSSIITYDQLLPTSEIKIVLRSIEGRGQRIIGAWRNDINEGVDLEILAHAPHEGISGERRDVISLSQSSISSSQLSTSSSQLSTSSAQLSTSSSQPAPNLKPLQSTSTLHLKPFESLMLQKIKNVEMIVNELHHQGRRIEHVLKGHGQLLCDVRGALKDAHKEQNTILKNLQGFENIFLENKEKSCPRLMYLGKKDSGKWISFRDAISTKLKFRVRFYCEFEHSESGTERFHEVKSQEGVDVSVMKDWARKIAPWLTVSLTVLSISTKIALNFALPGSGTLIANLGDIFLESAASPLVERIQKASGFSLEELSRVMNEEGEANFKTTQELSESSLDFMMEVLRELSTRDRQRQVGLRKVCLKFEDGLQCGAFSRVAWVCQECIDKFKESKAVSVTDLGSAF